jgi:hypothetical protein
MVVAGDKGWIKAEKETTEMTKEQLAGEKQNLYGGWVGSLLPLNDKAFTFTLLPEIKIDDKPTVGVKVSQKGRPDVSLYFDKATSLLAKIEQTVVSMDPKDKDKEVKQETFLSDYKDVDGYKTATKVVVKRGGKLFVEATISDLKPVEKFDEKVFARP